MLSPTPHRHPRKTPPLKGQRTSLLGHKSPSTISIIFFITFSYELVDCLGTNDDILLFGPEIDAQRWVCKYKGRAERCQLSNSRVAESRFPFQYVLPPKTPPQIYSSEPCRIWENQGSLPKCKLCSRSIHSSLSIGSESYFCIIDAWPQSRFLGAAGWHDSSTSRLAVERRLAYQKDPLDRKRGSHVLGSQAVSWEELPSKKLKAGLFWEGPWAWLCC